MNVLERMYLKYRDPQAYAIYKEHRRDEGLLNRIRQINAEPFNMPRKPDTSFKHSGNCGDIIFAMPAMLGLTGTEKEKNISLYLRTGQEVPYQQTMKHPLGNVSLNDRMVQMMTPLVLSQKHFSRCEVFQDQTIDYDLDRIRDYPLMLDRGNISRWYFLVFPGVLRPEQSLAGRRTQPRDKGRHRRGPKFTLPDAAHRLPFSSEIFEHLLCRSR